MSKLLAQTHVESGRQGEKDTSSISLTFFPIFLNKWACISKLSGAKLGNTSILPMLSKAILKYAVYENEMHSILERQILRIHKVRYLMIAIDGMGKTHSKLVSILYNLAYCLSFCSELSNFSTGEKRKTLELNFRFGYKLSQDLL